jgi:hypothetical protein
LFLILSPKTLDMMSLFWYATGFFTWPLVFIFRFIWRSFFLLSWFIVKPPFFDSVDMLILCSYFLKEYYASLFYILIIQSLQLDSNILFWFYNFFWDYLAEAPDQMSGHHLLISDIRIITVLSYKLQP